MLFFWSPFSARRLTNLFFFFLLLLLPSDPGIVLWQARLCYLGIRACGDGLDSGLKAIMTHYPFLLCKVNTNVFYSGEENNVSD